MSLHEWWLGVRWRGHRRPNEETSTKRFLDRLETLTFEVLHHNGAYAQCLGSDRNYYDWLALRDLYKRDKPLSDLLNPTPHTPHHEHP